MATADIALSLRTEAVSYFRRNQNDCIHPLIDLADVALSDGVRFLGGIDGH